MIIKRHGEWLPRYPRHGRPIELMVEASISLTDPRSSSTTRASGCEGGQLRPTSCLVLSCLVFVLSKPPNEWRPTGGLCCSLWLAVSWRGRCWAGLLPIPNTGGTIMTRVYPSPLRVLHRSQTAPLVGTVALSSAPLPLPLPHPFLRLLLLLLLLVAVFPRRCVAGLRLRLTSALSVSKGAQRAIVSRSPQFARPLPALPLPLPSTSLRPVRGRSSLSD
jgi:hypothetical protein